MSSIPISRKQEENLKKYVPELVEFMGPNLHDKGNKYHLAYLENMLHCGANYIPPEKFEPKNPNHQALNSQCGGWKKTVYPTAYPDEKYVSKFDSVPGLLGYHFRSLRKNPEDYALERSVSSTENEKMSTYIYNQYLDLYKKSIQKFQEPKQKEYTE